MEEDLKLKQRDLEHDGRSGSPTGYGKIQLKRATRSAGFFVVRNEDTREAMRIDC